LLRALWAFDAHGSHAGGPRANAVFFPRLTPTLEFAILGAVYSADVEGSVVESLAGGYCLSLLWQAAGSVQSPASLPHIHQVEGIYQVSFPCLGRYSPVTQPVTLEGNGGGVDGAESSGRCSSGSGAVWVFCLASGGLLGILWTLFERKVFPLGCPGSSPGPRLEPGCRWPLWGAAGGLHCFPFLA
jgi:hypothetical protein